jgi:hypothetical protein
LKKSIGQFVKSTNSYMEQQLILVGPMTLIQMKAPPVVRNEKPANKINPFGWEDAWGFFSILTFLIIILEMNPAKYFFLSLALLSHANPSGVTYEGVTPVHLA